MIKFISKGDLFESEAECYVNPISLFGVSKIGLDYDFKSEFPDNFDFYNQLSIAGETAIGKCEIYEVEKEENEDYEGLIIINFPVTSSAKWQSKLEYIESGLKDLVNIIKSEKIESIAIPPLGCDGNGQLNWEPVKKLIEKYLNIDSLKDVSIEVYEPLIKVYK